jgi:methionine--tRNA ligase beta chain
MKVFHSQHDARATAAVASSAIATLTVPAKQLSNDPVLQLVVTAATTRNADQLNVKTAATGGGVSLHLELLNGTVLKHRNSILRCLCGMGLHNLLDGAPYYLSGGHASPVAASPVHAMALASISSWMSVADCVRDDKEDYQELLGEVNAHLETRAFLVDHCPSMTVADVDLAVALVQKNRDIVASLKPYPHLKRWLYTIQECMKEQYKIPLMSDGAIPAPAQQGPPLFFYGNEEGVEIPKVASSAPPASAASQNKGNGGQPQAQQQSKKQAKAAAKQTKAPAPAPAPTAAVDVSALDIRIGQITKVWHHPESEKLFCEEIDLGEDQPRQIASGLRQFYETSQLENRRVVVLCNLKKRNLVGFPSHGMVLCASNADHTAVQIMEPPADAKIGERVTFEGFDGEPEAENKIAKKKIFEAVAPDLKTDAEGICVWKGAVSKTSAGPIKAEKGMAGAQVS